MKPKDLAAITKRRKVAMKVAGRRRAKAIKKYKRSVAALIRARGNELKARDKR